MEELINAVVGALQAAGLDADSALPAETLLGLEGPRLAVGIQSASRGRVEYLGTDDEAQEAYGQSVSAAVYVDVYSPAALGGTACTETAWAACEALMQGVEGLDVRKVSLQRCRFDGSANCFLCSAEAEVGGYLVGVSGAGDEPDADVITGFRLRGTLNA